jgi:hypothetical protein
MKWEKEIDDSSGQAMTLIDLPVDNPALTAGPFSRTCFTNMVSIGIIGSSSPADIPRSHSSGQSFNKEKITIRNRQLSRKTTLKTP